MIKIKLGIVDSDRLYLERLTELIGKKYRNQIEIYSFTEPSSVLQAVRENRINVLAVSQDTEIKTENLAEFCMFAYLTDSAVIDTYKGHRTICRYQRADVIYKQILGLYSEKLADKVRYRMSGIKKSRISLFCSVCEGDGATTAAAAFAEHLAQHGKKTLFLSLKQFGDTGKIFSAEGEGSFTDIIFALKSRKANITLKLESAVKQSRSGVYFYDQCRNPLDCTEIKDSELRTLIDEMSSNFGYSNIVIVSDFFISDKLVTLLEYASDVIYVSGDSGLSRERFEQKSEVIGSIEKRRNINISDKMKIIFNKSGYIKTFPVDIPVVGIQPELDIHEERDIVRSFSSSEMFSKLYAEEDAV